jgi:glutamyl-tRNA synthetase
MRKIIFKQALINAYLHKGKADVKAVVKRTIAEKPSLREKIDEVIKLTKKIVKEVNKLSLEEQERKIKELKIKIPKKEERVGLPPLPKAVRGRVITAFPPEPSKFPHLGHAKAALLNYEYAKMYNGKFVLRFEDTNPEKVKKIYYKEIENGLKWLGIKWHKKEFISDFIPKFYEIAEFFIKKGYAYVCLCKRDKIKRLRYQKKECEHRNQSIEKNLALWRKMLSEFKGGKAHLRLKIDMKHKNAVMRDPTIMRIVESKHPRKGGKYRVWPLYDFATSLMDAWEGVTHRLRSKEFEIRKELQQYIQKLVGAKPPIIIEFGRLNLKGVPTSGRVIRKLIGEKKLTGWDDPRLTTLIALKRRGFLPQAISEFVISTGISKAEALLEWDALEAINRKYVDPIANRYFGVFDPVKIKIKNAPNVKFVKVKIHPEKKKFRKIQVNLNSIYIEKEDLRNLRGKEVALIGLFTVKLGKTSKFLGEEIKFETPKIHWVSEPHVKCEIILPNARRKTILVEPNILNEKKGGHVQLVRRCFGRIDKILKKKIVIYFTHK